MIIAVAVKHERMEVTERMGTQTGEDCDVVTDSIPL